MQPIGGKPSNNSGTERNLLGENPSNNSGTERNPKGIRLITPLPFGEGLGGEASSYALWSAPHISFSLRVE